MPDHATFVNYVITSKMMGWLIISSCNGLRGTYACFLVQWNCGIAFTVIWICLKDVISGWLVGCSVGHSVLPIDINCVCTICVIAHIHQLSILNAGFIALQSWMFYRDWNHCFSFHSPPLFLAISQRITSLFSLNTSASDSNMWLQHKFWIQWLI